MLVRFDEARRNLGLSLVRSIEWPFSNLVARPTIAASDFAAGHRRVMQVGAAGGASLLALRAVSRLRGGRFLGPAGRATREAAGMALQAEATPNILQGGATDGSRSNPYWVVIHPWSYSVTGSGFGGTSPTKGDSQVKKILEKAGLTGAGAAGSAGGVAGAGTAVTAGSLLAPLAVLGAAAYFGQKTGPRHSDFEMAIDRGSQVGKLNPGGIARLAGQMDVTVRMVDAQGRPIHTQQKKGVPVKMWNDVAFPTKQGKRGSAKGR
jgi:hypothetical protein